MNGKSPSAEQRHRGLQSLTIAFGSAIGSGVFGAILLIHLTFATLINPDLSGKDWWQDYAANLLVSTWHNLLILVAFSALFWSFTSLSALQLTSAVFARPRIEHSLVSAPILGALLTFTELGILYFIMTRF